MIKDDRGNGSTNSNVAFTKGFPEVDAMRGYPIVLTADRSMMSNYRNNYLFGFITCGPVEHIPEFVFKRLLAPSVKVKGAGEVECAPYGLRKVEATLLQEYKENEVTVAHPDYVENFIGENTKVVGISAMDPLGMGPVTSSFGSNTLTPYNRKKFRELMDRLKKNRYRHKYKVILGGSGAWQLAKREYRIDYGIDHIIFGDIDGKTQEVFHKIVDGTAEEIITLGSVKSIDDIPTIRKPSLNALVEIMRGCGRGCTFCDPTTQKKLDIPLDRVMEEVKVNSRCFDFAALHSDDFLLYGCDNKDFYPNRDAIINLFSHVRRMEGISHISLTHCSLSPVALDSELIEKISKICKRKTDSWLGIQPGIETASPVLIKKHMPQKTKPFSPEEWPDVVRKAIKILNDNRWYVAATLIIGLPGEEDEDVEETLSLVEDLSESDCLLAPLLYVDYETDVQLTLNDLTVMQWELFYECWKHNCRQFNKWVWESNRGWNPLTRVIVSVLTRIGVKKILDTLEATDRDKLKPSTG